MISKIVPELEHIAVPVEELHEDPDNVRVHDDRSHEAVAESFNEFGQRKPLIALENGKVIAGNAGLVAARDLLGWTHVAVVRFADDEEEKALRYAIADNRTGELSWFDSAQLKEAVRKLSGINPSNTVGLGFTKNEVDKMVAGLAVDLRPESMFRDPGVVPLREGGVVAGVPGVELVRVDELKPHPRNYRVHPDDQIEHLIQSIQDSGIYRNVVVARDYTVLAGQGVVEAVKRMGRDRVPCIRLDLDPDDPKALKIMATDNEVSRAGTQDDRKLSEILREVHEEVGLAGTGYDEQKLASYVMVTRPQSEVKDFDEAAEWVGMPEFTPAEEPKRLMVLFETEDDRNTFVKNTRLNIMLRGKIATAWWPDRGRRDLKSIRVEEEDPAER